LKPSYINISSFSKFEKTVLTVLNSGDTTSGIKYFTYKNNKKLFTCTPRSLNRPRVSKSNMLIILRNCYHIFFQMPLIVWFPNTNTNCFRPKQPWSVRKYLKVWSTVLYILYNNWRFLLPLLSKNAFFFIQKMYSRFAIIIYTHRTISGCCMHVNNWYTIRKRWLIET